MANPISLSINKIEKKEKIKLEGKVSSIFSKSLEKLEEKKEKIKKEESNKLVQLELKKLRKQNLNIKKTDESSFMKLLKAKKNNEEIPKPVPTPIKTDDDHPIIGFGELILRKQGWAPGKNIGLN